ncbi:hypothetical protein Zmor_017379 [Zophobas morio]|uniref:Protein hunchback n=1 Tax=Zophobas morio TaxID=2755281 RepID=A0AA38I8C8_9CUCU|nr:hypothetical protein Zmor_017379 [Zophobas morio]
MEAYHHCKDCDFKTELTVLFGQHINQHYDPKRESSEDISSEDSSKENYGCAKYYFEPNLSLKSFQNSAVCTETKESSQSVSSLEESATCSSDFKQTEEGHWYYCHKCTYKCKVKNTLTRHIEVLHLHRWYACDKCPFKTKWKGNLTVHINTMHLDEHEGKWYKCQKCQFKTRTKGNLKSHINNVHVNVKWYTCNECFHKTKHKTLLQRHVLVKHKYLNKRNI